MTQRTHELVPVCAFVGGQVLSIGVHGATAEIPLLSGPMNQNGIHLASNLYFLADWVAALAIVGALPGVTGVGYHPPDHSTPIQVWMIEATIRHFAPGTGRLVASWCLPDVEASRVRRELAQSGKAEVVSTVQIRNDSEQVIAEVDLRQLVLALSPLRLDTAPTILQAHQGKQSASFIAALRPDPMSRALAGAQGSALSERMVDALPGLPALVEARTASLDKAIRSGQFEQVLVLGLGLDSRPSRYRHLRWFGVDLPATIAHRRERYAALKLDDPSLVVIGDLRGTRWQARLERKGFCRNSSTLFVVEGLSMYLESTELDELVEQVHGYAGHGESRLWMDHVAPELLSSELPAARAFLDEMARLGEPFIHGVGGVEALSAGWSTVWREPAGTDAVAAGYFFSLAAPL